MFDSKSQKLPISRLISEYELHKRPMLVVILLSKSEKYLEALNSQKQTLDSFGTNMTHFNIFSTFLAL